MACGILRRTCWSELIAGDSDEYIRIAAELAPDVPKLDELPARSLRRS